MWLNLSSCYLGLLDSYNLYRVSFIFFSQLHNLFHIFFIWTAVYHSWFPSKKVSCLIIIIKFTFPPPLNWNAGYTDTKKIHIYRCAVSAFSADLPMYLSISGFINHSSIKLEKAMAPHSSTLAWKIPWTEEAGGLQSMGLRRVRTTERLPFHFSLSCIGEGNDNPLQCSCLENPRDEGAWWAALYGVTQNRTRLK